MPLADKLLVNIGTAVTTIGAAAFWVATTSARVEASEKRQDAFQVMASRVLEIVESIDRRVSRIEGKISSSTCSERKK